MTVRVSYVAATKNRKGFVAKALPRWKELKGPDDELIVVDGASTDGTHETLKDADPGLIDCLIHEPDRSEAHAFNKGFLAARGVLVKPLTDDDEFYRNGLEKAYEVMLAHPEIDMLNTGGEYVTVTDDGHIKIQRYIQGSEDPDPKWRVCQAGLGLVVRRKSFAAIGLIDPRHMLADVSLMTQAITRGANFRFLQVKTYRHHIHPHSFIGKHGSWRGRRERNRIWRDLNAPFVSLHTRLEYLWRPGLLLRRLPRKVHRLLVGWRPAWSSTEPDWDCRLY